VLFFLSSSLYEQDFTLDFELVEFLVVLVGFVHLPPQFLVVDLDEVVALAEQQADFVPFLAVLLVVFVVLRSIIISFIFFLVCVYFR